MTRENRIKLADMKSDIWLNNKAREADISKLQSRLSELETDHKRYVLQFDRLSEKFDNLIEYLGVTIEKQYGYKVIVKKEKKYEK